MLRVSKKHGVNPSVTVCYFCGADTGVALVGKLPGDAEAPHRLVDREPCPACKGLMKQGVMLLSVKDGEKGDNPFRTGLMVVVKDEVIERIFQGEAVQKVLAARVAFMDDTTWGMLGLPKGAEAGKRVTGSSFDYAEAWRQVARPGFEALPADIRELLDQVTLKAGELHQESNTLNMPWPDDERELRNRFENLDSEWLAQAARIIYFYGHWAPSGKARGLETWKFANYADQVLRARCGLPLSQYRQKHMGMWWDIREGFLYICYDSHRGWSSCSVGLGTPGLLERARAWRGETTVDLDTLGEVAELMANELWPTNGFMPHFRNPAEHFIEEVYEDGTRASVRR